MPQKKKKKILIFKKKKAVSVKSLIGKFMDNYGHWVRCHTQGLLFLINNNKLCNENVIYLNFSHFCQNLSVYLSSQVTKFHVSKEPLATQYVFRYFLYLCQCS